MSTEKKQHKFNLIAAILKTLVGFVVIFIFMTVVMGGPNVLSNGLNNVLILLMMSVMCTAGVGLVFWILVSYAVGAFVFRMLEIRFNDVEIDKPHVKSYTVEQSAIVEYIKQARRQNFKDDAISSLLKINGWSESDIKEGFEETKK